MLGLRDEVIALDIDVAAWAVLAIRDAERIDAERIDAERIDAERIDAERIDAGSPGGDVVVENYGWDANGVRVDRSNAERW